MAPKTDTHAAPGDTLGAITVTVMNGPQGRGLAISSDGDVQPTDLFLAAAHLTRVANQLLDAATFRAAQSTDAKGIEVVRAMPDALQQ
jgi:hypothetical protein